MAAKSAEQVALDKIHGLAMNQMRDDTALEIVSALRSAGWLRDSNEEPALRDTVARLKEALSAITRERDEAQKMRDYHEGRQRVAESSVATLSNALAFVRKERDEARRKEADTSDAMVYVMQAIESATGEKPVAMFVPELLERWRRNLVATQSSPEVLAVVEALAEHKRQVPTSFRDIKRHYTVSWEGVVAAFNAYEAAIERKAEPKPRFRVIHADLVRPEFPWCVIEGEEPREGFARSYHRVKFDADAECRRLNAADAAGRKS